MPSLQCIVVLIVTFCFQFVFAFPLTPDPQMTPGDLCTTHDPDFKEFRYQENIPYCYRSVSSSTKKQIYVDYSIPTQCKKRFTIDHFIPLSLGGSNSKLNLWPEHVYVKATRQNLENQLYWDIRGGKITQAEAIEIIVEAKTQLLEISEQILKSNNCDTPTF